MLRNIIKNNKGQGLVEMVIALAVIVTGVIGALSLAVSALSSSKESETRIIAANLAREGIEVARNIRDSNWLAGCPSKSQAGEAYDWDNNMDKCYEWDTGLQKGTAVAVFDPESGSWSLNFKANDISDSLARFYRKGGVYIQGVENPAKDYVKTAFYRIIVLNEICLDGEGNETIKDGGGSCEEDDEDKIGIEVRSQVNWSEHNRSHNLEAIDRLYNWR